MTERDLCDGPRDLASDESSPTSGRLVVEEDTVRGVHSVRLSVVLDDPERVELRDSVRRTRVEGSSLGLRSFDNLSVKFGSRGLEGFRKKVDESSAQVREVEDRRLTW